MMHTITTTSGTITVTGTAQYGNAGYIKRIVYDAKGNVREIEYFGPNELNVTGWPAWPNPYLTPTVPNPTWPSMPWTITC